ncbi:MAG TPA: hypothetical protein VHV79_12570 [Mycobacteriales bacterium]|nr:hypothetical protein [Mycobacteriales bacterium]
MSDITDLFHRIAPVDDAGPSPDVVEADLARGRQALIRDHRRRTIRRSMAATSTIAAAAVLAVIIAQVGGSTPRHAAALSQPPTAVKAHQQTKQHVAATHAAIKPIKLVAYTGKQLAGFTVEKVPAGWALSTSTQYALLIDANGDTNNNPDAFEGKLAVLTQSTDVHGLGKGDHVTVNGQPGVISDHGKSGLSLTYNDAGGFGVVIQAPASLNWTDQQLADFADGVHATGNALPGHG